MVNRTIFLQLLEAIKVKTQLLDSQIGKQAGISPQYISNIKKGRKVPSMLYLEKLATAFNYSLEVTFHEL